MISINPTGAVCAVRVMMLVVVQSVSVTTRVNPVIAGVTAFLIKVIPEN
jgi:hypothetical protein